MDAGIMANPPSAGNSRHIDHLFHTLAELKRRRRLRRKVASILMRRVNLRRQQRALRVQDPKRMSPEWLVQREAHYAGETVHRYPRVLGSEEPEFIWPYDFGSDKMSFVANQYACAYGETLITWTHARVVVEIEILDGSGLALWSEVFPDARLVGIDSQRDLFDANIQTLVALGAFGRSIIPHVLEVDAYRPNAGTLSALSSLGPVEVVIDDGPHTFDAIERMARALRPFLAESFLSIVEDNPGCRSIVNRVFAGHARTRTVGGLVIAERRT